MASTPTDTWACGCEEYEPRALGCDNGGEDIRRDVTPPPTLLLRGRVTGGTDASRRKLAAAAILEAIREDQARQRFQEALDAAAARVDRALGREVAPPPAEC